MRAGVFPILAMAVLLAACGGGAVPASSSAPPVASQLASANGLKISAPAGATVLVNVTGIAGQMQSFGMTVSGTDRQHVLFNFAAATTLTLAGISAQVGDNGELEFLIIFQHA